jgi:hypothetical protein
MTVLLEREVVEGPQIQGEDEEIVWTLDITNWGSSPTDISVVVKNEAGTDVTSSVTTGSPYAASSVYINLPTIHSLTAGVQYRVEVKFTANGQVFEAFFILICEI